MCQLSANFIGKIPLSAEFIRHSRGVREIEHIDAWLQDGLERARLELGEDWAASFDAAPVRRFVYFSRQTGETFAGVLCASHDSAGRRYPFVLGSRVPPSSVEGEFEHLPFSLSHFLSDAASLATTGWMGTSLEGYRERLRSASWSMRTDQAQKDFSDYLRLRPASSVWGCTRLATDEQARTRLLHRVWSTVAADPRPGAMLRLPITDGSGGVAFWLAVLRSWSRSSMPPAFTVWEEAGPGEPTVLRVVLDHLSVKNFEAVFWGGGRGALSARTTGVGREAPHQIASGRRLFGRAVASSASMQSLLDELRGVPGGHFNPQ